MLKHVSRTLLLCSLLYPLSSIHAADNQTTTSANERYRPQFHFTAPQNWLNDPNGCVYYDGEYHLFYQHNPKENVWGNMTWGHAVSTDLLHWEHLPLAIEPYSIEPHGEGTIFSGTAVVDVANTSGFQTGEEKPLVALFTHATKRAGQAMAYSNDRGRTWTLYEKGKHVVPNQGLDVGERDPKVFWHEPTRKWIMALWVRLGGTVRFFTSDNLKDWEFASDFTGEGFFECPDIFEAAVDGNPGRKKWVLYDAIFNYWIGNFDGKEFQAEAGPFRGDSGKHFYAAQTWNNVPDRTIQIAWMRDGKYPDMPFNQQMSFPCELGLRTTSEGVRLYRTPVREIEKLYKKTMTLDEQKLKPGESFLKEISGDLFDIELVLDPGTARALTLHLHEQAVTWSGNEISCGGTTATLAPRDGLIKLRLLVDRTSLELFGNDGELSITNCILPSKLTTEVALTATDGEARLLKGVIRHLRSTQEQP